MAASHQQLLVIHNISSVPGSCSTFIRVTTDLNTKCQYLNPVEVFAHIQKWDLFLVSESCLTLRFCAQITGRALFSFPVAMGGAQSSELGQSGFHVLKVKENSPAYYAGIEQFFDYIISVNGVRVDNGDSQTLLNILNESEGKTIPVELYSSKEQAFREVMLTPSKDWHENIPGEKSLIGCSIRFCSYERAGEHVWHVLSVAANSPAEMAGIIPQTDYIIGSPHTVLAAEDDFYNLVEDHLGKPLSLYLYNTEWDSCRQVIIVPNHDWGGTGSLGCDIGYGLLHRIPRKTASARPSQDASAQYSSTIFNSLDVQPAPSYTADPAISPESPSQSLHQEPPKHQFENNSLPRVVEP
ncbi:GRASP55/65 PDZ-like domain-containing protein [Dichotomocladium elegans]|nr:GRASP55/65 PDZ-like domain-containing protein [Dichotomocladium elegans]